MTNSFFGAGIVDLPADASKRAKNCGKMHMVFFVHDGKVMVEVGPSKMEFNQFALTKGGVWIVPRGKPLLFTFIPISNSPYPPNGTFEVVARRAREAVPSGLQACEA